MSALLIMDGPLEADHDSSWERQLAPSTQQPSSSATAEDRWMPALLIMDGPLLRTMTVVGLFGSGKPHPTIRHPPRKREDRWMAALLNMDGPLLRTMTVVGFFGSGKPHPTTVILRHSGGSMDIGQGDHRWSAAADHDGPKESVACRLVSVTVHFISLAGSGSLYQR